LTLAKNEGKSDDISTAMTPQKPIRKVEDRANGFSYWDSKKQSDSSAD
jgi:hypothetical protein